MLSIGDDPAQNGRAIIPSESHHQEPNFPDLFVGFEVVGGVFDFDSGGG
jgi:hypothetical protein